MGKRRISGNNTSYWFHSDKDLERLTKIEQCCFRTSGLLSSNNLARLGYCIGVALDKQSKISLNELFDVFEYFYKHPSSRYLSIFDNNIGKDIYYKKSLAGRQVFGYFLDGTNFVAQLLWQYNYARLMNDQKSLLALELPISDFRLESLRVFDDLVEKEDNCQKLILTHIPRFGLDNELGHIFLSKLTPNGWEVFLQSSLKLRQIMGLYSYNVESRNDMGQLYDLIKTKQDDKNSKNKKNLKTQNPKKTINEDLVGKMTNTKEAFNHTTASTVVSNDDTSSQINDSNVQNSKNLQESNMKDVVPVVQEGNQQDKAGVEVLSNANNERLKNMRKILQDTNLMNAFMGV